MTEVIYYIDKEPVPYIIDLNKVPDEVTLKDFKNALKVINGNAKCFLFFFKKKSKISGNLN